MLEFLWHWLIYAVSLAAVAAVFPKIRLKGFGSAVIAAAVFAVLNVTLGFALNLLTLPFNWLTFGLVHAAINGFLFWLAGEFLDGFDVEGWLTAILGAFAYTVLAQGLIRLLG